MRTWNEYKRNLNEAYMGNRGDEVFIRPQGKGTDIKGIYFNKK